MEVLGIVLLVLFVIDAVLLIILVLAQNEQGDSLGGLFAGSSSTAFGSRSSNILIKITGGLATVFFLGSFALAMINRSSGNLLPNNELVNSAYESLLKTSASPSPAALSSAETLSSADTANSSAAADGKSPTNP